MSKIVRAFAPAILAVCAWLSLNPYVVWGSSNHLKFAAIASGFAAAFGVWAGDRPTPSELAPLALISTFVVYISVLPSMDGAVIRWVYVLPTLFACFILSESGRAVAIRCFAVLFALSLLPAIAVSLWCISGLPITFQPLAHLNSTMAEAGARYLMVPGALMLESNGLLLPWGGMLYRICAVYDEPGMVGTISALLLLSNRMDLKAPTSWILLLGGVLSFSVAFAVLTIVGLIYRVMTKPSPSAIAWLGIVGLSVLLALGVVRPPVNPNVTSRIVVASSTVSIPQPKVIDPSVPPAPTELRQSDRLINRSLPEMDSLISSFWRSDLRTLALGMGSDASVVMGGVSAVIDRIYTDYGLVGFTLYVLGFGSLCLTKIRHADDRAWITLFVLMFLLSAYQRPVIWLPYTLLILICSGSRLRRVHDSISCAVPSPSPSTPRRAS